MISVVYTHIYLFINEYDITAQWLWGIGIYLFFAYLSLGMVHVRLTQLLHNSFAYCRL